MYFVELFTQKIFSCTIIYQILIFVQNKSPLDEWTSVENLAVNFIASVVKNLRAIEQGLFLLYFLEFDFDKTLFIETQKSSLYFSKVNIHSTLACIYVFG